MHYDELEKKINHKERMTMDEVYKDIDIDNLSRFIITTVFCGNWDNVQGAAIFNREECGSKMVLGDVGYGCFVS